MLKSLLAVALVAVVVTTAHAAAVATGGGASTPAPTPDWWDRIPYLAKVTALLTALATVLTLLKVPARVMELYARIASLRRCYRLLRGCETGRWRTIVTLSDILRPNWGLFTLSNDVIIERTRRRQEHAIFRPRPVWPLPEGHPDLDEETGEMTGERRKVLRRGHQWRLKEWRATVAKIEEGAEGRIIKILHPGRITKRQKEIQTYFTAAEEHLRGPHTDRFITPIEVKTGFIAPLHLLAGLLVHFNEKWPAIIDSFNLEGSRPNNVDFGPRSADIRQIQLFIYNCWLLWGPSIPICKPTCGLWDGDVVTMQYGFADENNAIDIVGLAKRNEGKEEALVDQVQRLVDLEKELIKVANDSDAAEGKASEDVLVRKLSCMALPASVTGYLRTSKSLKKRVGNRDVSRLPQAAQKSYLGEQDDRPLLYVHTIEQTDAEAKAFPAMGLAKQAGHEAARYYSAYLWVAFVMLGKVTTPGADEGDWRPVHQAHLDKASPDYSEPLDNGSAKPWLDLIPFFEHGNIADSETCAFLKRQLARKIVGAFLELLQSIDIEKPTHRFAYACAIDDPGCTPDHFLMTDLQGGDTMKVIIKRMLDDGEKVDPRYAAIKKIVDFDVYGRTYHPLAACTFPTHIDGHYTQMAKQEKLLRKRRAENNSRYEEYFDENPYWEAYAPAGDRPVIPHA